MLAKDTFDTRFTGWGFEDTELGYRLEKKGMQLWYVPKARVAHLHDITEEGFEKRMENAGRNAVLFEKLHGEVGVIPRGWKKIVKQLLAAMLPGFWARGTRAFLKGVDEAKKQS